MNTYTVSICNYTYYWQYTRIPVLLSIYKDTYSVRDFSNVGKEK